MSGKYQGDIVESIVNVEFTILDNATILRSSVFRGETYGLSVPQSSDNGMPVPLGVLDPHMGPFDNSHRCSTCELSMTECPGHAGHRELAKPVYNVIFIEIVGKIFHMICYKCSKLLITGKEKEIAKILLLKSNLARFKKNSSYCKNITYCPNCNTPVPKVEIDKSTSINIVLTHVLQNTIQEEFGADAQTTLVEKKKEIRQVLSAEMCYNILKAISDTDCLIMGLDPKKCRPENMIIKNLHIPPVAIRPSVKNPRLRDDDLTAKLCDIIRNDEKLRAHMLSTTPNAKYISEHITLLQYHISTLQDNESTKMPRAEQRSGKTIVAIKQRLVGKEGRIRNNLQGKRVDYSGRSPIDPDMYISIEELGVPKKIAMNLTFPEEVTPLNIVFLTKLVENGPMKYPGANHIETLERNINGEKRLISLSSNKRPIKLHYGDIVKRHLLNGDTVLFNRQPSLHKPSMMTHRAHILLDPDVCCFRMNVSATTPYNADYDGDEMNIHVPQSIQTAIELKMIASVSRQVISVGSSKPIIACVQDTLMGAYKLTKTTTTISWKNVMNFLAGTTMSGKKQIVKGKEYTGHELFSLILPEGLYMTYRDINIKNGQLINGTIKSAHIGHSKNNIIHKIWYNFGPHRIRDFIDDSQKLIVFWLMNSGFSMGASDFMATKECHNKLHNIIEGKKLEINHLITESENNPTFMAKALFERSITAELKHISDNQLDPETMKDLPSTSHLKMCIDSGSKGKESNASAIIIAVGQQVVEGERVKLNYNGRSLPYFHKDDDSATARGFCTSSFSKGLTPPEYTFHTMAGREGIIDTAVKTADTGYLQRKLIKAMEDIQVCYDRTVRNATGIVIQFSFGGTNINPERQITQTLKIVRMDNKDMADYFLYGDKDVPVAYKEYNQVFYNKLLVIRDTIRVIQRKMYATSKFITDEYGFPFDLSQIITNAMEKKYEGPIVSPEYVLEKIEDLLEHPRMLVVPMSERDWKNKDSLKHRDDYDSKLFVSALIYEQLAPKRCTNVLKMTKKTLDVIIDKIMTDYNRAMLPAGEMVGTIAAQSIGEPATQMTLHSIHSTGKGKSQSLGIPRLKEIIGFTKQKGMKSPQMIIPLKNVPDTKDIATKVASYIQYLTLKDVVNKVEPIYDPEPFQQYGYLQMDDVDNVYHPHGGVSANSCQTDVASCPWLIRLVLNKEMLLEKNITMLDIKSQFCRRWARRFEDSKKLKSIKKNVLTKVTNCTILSNYDNSPQPIIHIRVEMVNYEYATIQMLTDFLLNFKLRGVSGIHTIEDVDKEKHKEFDKDGKEVDNEKYMITVGGVNLMGVRYINGIDYDKILCNDIVQIYETYGIHAARAAIAREIKTVIDNSGSSVNAAHLFLLNDVMTNTGELTAVNRFGINKLDTDPFSRASFEQTVDQFTQAAVFNEIDYMRSVSACIIGGKPFIGGTNICELLLDTDAVVNMDMEGHEESENKHLKISDFTNNSLLDNLMQESGPKK